jgi:hypothetical protein
MAAKVIQFPGAKSWNLQKIDTLIEERLVHGNPEVLRELKLELKALVAKYYDDQEVVLRLPLPEGLSAAQVQEIEEQFHQVFQAYHEGLVKQTHAIFLDLCLAKLEICELRQALKEQDPD